MVPGYILKFAFGLLGSLIGNLLFGSPERDQPRKADEQVRPPIVAVRSFPHPKLEVPLFVTHVPEGHFAGVSAPMPSLAQARRSAMSDVVRQILGSIGVQYEHRYLDNISGHVRGQGLQRRIDDWLRGVSHGIVIDIERNIVESSWSQDTSGKYLYFVLIRCPQERLEEMQRLSKGARVVASMVSATESDVCLRVTEANGVSVVLSSADVTVKKRNRLAGVIKLFLWSVSEGSEETFSVAFSPITVCGSSSEVLLTLKRTEKGIMHYFLGMKVEQLVVLKGHDEIGRPVSVAVTF